MYLISPMQLLQSGRRFSALFAGCKLIHQSFSASLASSRFKIELKTTLKSSTSSHFLPAHSPSPQLYFTLMRSGTVCMKIATQTKIVFFWISTSHSILLSLGPSTHALNAKNKLWGILSWSTQQHFKPGQSRLGLAAGSGGQPHAMGGGIGASWGIRVLKVWSFVARQQATLTL